MLFPEFLVLIRGGGDLASGTILRLARAGFPVVVLELDYPLAVRREVAFASAVQRGEFELEGVKGVRTDSIESAPAFAEAGIIPVLVDPAGQSIPLLNPQVLVDARMTKSREESSRDSAPLVVGLGPGFSAGVNCHAVVETNRGPYLGRVYWRGSAESNTGRPDAVMGRDYDRVLRSPGDGIIEVHAEIGDVVVERQTIATVGDNAVEAPFGGALRGIIAPGTPVTAGMKIGDIDPRGSREYCFSVSDKSLAVGGGVLEAILTWLNRNSSEPSGSQS
ncbi:MAG TPA: selenium-dependent molybdenum cofactor biosynthesis protein YqeB [Acidobacteriota bacterium]|nr:selenium-dependent molybdenum cofactor biosynthesis protein YqeB [Acidobacteriota bacterium]